MGNAARSIKGRVALVTGAASGMGRATAELLAEEGAYVIVTDRAADTAQLVVDGIMKSSGSARAWAMDVTDPAAIVSVLAQAADHFGKLDIVVNNAGISGFLSLDDPG